MYKYIWMAGGKYIYRWSTREQKERRKQYRLEQAERRKQYLLGQKLKLENGIHRLTE